MESDENCVDTLNWPENSCSGACIAKHDCLSRIVSVAEEFEDNFADMDEPSLLGVLEDSMRSALYFMRCLVNEMRK